MFYTNTRSYGTPRGWLSGASAAQPPALSQTPLPSSASFVSSPRSGGRESSPLSSPALLPPPSSSVLQDGQVGSRRVVPNLIGANGIASGGGSSPARSATIAAAVTGASSTPFR